MKRHFYLILILTAQVLWPFITFGQDIDSCCHIFEVHETSMGYSGNCIPDSNGDWLFYKNMNTYIPYMNLAEPLSNSPIKTIEININIIQKDDSSGNFENNQSTINRFRNVITYVNSFFSNYAPSDKIDWVQELPNYDSRIRFSIGEEGQERIYFYQNSSAWDDTYVHENIEDFLETYYPERLERLNLYIFGNPYNQNWAHAAFPSWSNQNSHSWVVMKYWGSDENDWAKSTLLAHELGHTLDLLHTYYGGGASAICNQLNENFLQDVFLVELPSVSNCPHTGNWNDNPYFLDGDRITNNLLGGTSAQRYISPQQSGQMHRALALTSIRKYVKCEKSEVPLEILTNQSWDFDINPNYAIETLSGGLNRSIF